LTAVVSCATLQECPITFTPCWPKEKCARRSSRSVEKSTVTRWDDNGIPLKRVFEIEKETGIPREKLSPKYFARARQ
jgi:hypothetical protein